MKRYCFPRGTSHVGLIDYEVADTPAKRGTRIYFGNSLASAESAKIFIKKNISDKCE